MSIVVRALLPAAESGPTIAILLAREILAPHPHEVRWADGKEVCIDIGPPVAVPRVPAEAWAKEIVIGLGAKGVPAWWAPRFDPSDPFGMLAVVSSNIRRVGYDPRGTWQGNLSVGERMIRRILRVEFLSSSIYDYADVPPEEYRGLLLAESKGKALGPIKAVHPFWKIK